MRLNINDASRLDDLKTALAKHDVSPSAIATLERALARGMSFERAGDLDVLDISAADATSLRAAVAFGPPVASASNVRTVEYRFEPVGDRRAFYGYQLIVRVVSVAGFTTEAAYAIDADSPVFVDYDLAAIRPGSQVALYVKAPTGSRTTIKISGSAGDAANVVEVAAADLANAVLEVTVEARNAVPNPAVVSTYRVKGRVISNKSDAKLDGYQVVLFAATNPIDQPPAFVAVAVAHTETNGNFVTTPLLFEQLEDVNHVTAAKATVDHEDFHAEVPVRLVTAPETDSAPGTSKIPERIIIVIDEDAQPTPNASTDDCGCNDLNFFDRKVLEEYSYYTVVRTSEPSIIADVLEDEPLIDLQDIYGVPKVVPYSVFQKYQQIKSRQPTKTPISASSGTAPATIEPTAIMRSAIPMGVPRKIPLDENLMDTLVTEYQVREVVETHARPVFRGRTHLDPMHQIDWDEPEIYQAASIAHGHLLHFKQEWIPDGYSIGDLIYSLPLAPGQEKQIAVINSEIEESAAKSQALNYEETLNNSLVRDRDVNEVIAGTLTENINADSHASTRGIGFGLGAAAMGAFTGGFYGGLLGISGGASGAGSEANSDATRAMTASSLQHLTDRTQQAASVVRSQRATVVQTVAQGQSVAATAESVANYNHCHAMTIQYFEVLRHLAVRTRLADVQECLFVPLQMLNFDIDRTLRWRSTLERFVPQRLQGGFDALGRISREKESPFENYYDSIGFPRKNYAERPITFYQGDLVMEFTFFNTNDGVIDAAMVAFFASFGVLLGDHRDRKLTDEELAKVVGPRTIERLLDAFTVETDKGVDLHLDLTLLSTFRQGVPLRVSLRNSTNTPDNVPREAIDNMVIKLDSTKLPTGAVGGHVEDKYMKIRLRTGALRYRTDLATGTLFEGRIDNDVFADGDGASLPTPLTREELRNPRGEDVDAANSVIQHLNENLEHYNKVLFLNFSAERRFMLLDGIIAPGKANGRSVASVVDNRVIGIAGNSLILPVAPGYQLDPTIDDTFDLFAQYYTDEPDPLRISMPTKGVYTEAVLGKCNSCEMKDERRYWRWEESPIPNSPTTQILPLNTDSRRADPGSLEPKDFPSPVVNIQNAPNAPDPTGLQNLLTLMGKGDAFRDLTGLNQNQLNALSAYQKALDTAKEFGSEASELAQSMAKIQAAKDAQKSGILSTEETATIVKGEFDPDEQAKAKAKETQQKVDTIADAKDKGRLDDSQSKPMTEDTIRKDQGTTRPVTAKSKPTGKRKIKLVLDFDDYRKAPLEGTWDLTYGSLVHETFESVDGVAEFDVDVDDTSPPQRLVLKGNPWLALVSFPPGAEYYYHYIRIRPKLSSGATTLSIRFSQSVASQTVSRTTSESDSEMIARAIAQERGNQRQYSGESGALQNKVLGKVAANATFFHKDTTTTTDGSAHEEGESTTVPTTVEFGSQTMDWQRLDDGE